MDFKKTFNNSTACDHDCPSPKTLYKLAIATLVMDHEELFSYLIISGFNPFFKSGHKSCIRWYNSSYSVVYG